jgi:hypothetical protein
MLVYDPQNLTFPAIPVHFTMQARTQTGMLQNLVQQRISHVLNCKAS